MLARHMGQLEGLGEVARKVLKQMESNTWPQRRRIRGSLSEPRRGEGGVWGGKSSKQTGQEVGLYFPARASAFSLSSFVSFIFASLYSLRRAADDL
jgi:hypothetical protein